MNGILLLVSMLLLLVSVQACTNSYECGQGSCCVDGNGHILTDQQLGGFGGPHFHLGGAPLNGTCVRRHAQKGEMCDSNCQCGAGLKCYRPMSGVCCPPMLCYDEAYVIQQQHYWSNCMKDPHCALPP